MERTLLQSHSVYAKMPHWGGTAGGLGRALDFVGRRPYANIYHGLLRVIDETVGRLLPRRWGRIMVTVAEKT
jgi:hypothetical protein